MLKKETSARRSHLSAIKQTVLQKLLRGELASLPDMEAIPRRPLPQDPAPLSFAQQRLWFLDQLEPNNTFYNIPAAVRLSGMLDIPALERSINEVLLRHEVLRTVFSEVNGQPVQVITPHQALPLRVIDLSSLPEAGRETEVQHLIAEEVQRPFHLAQGPLLRLMLLRLEEQEHVLLITVHHIVSDDWSMGILFRELATLYQAFVAGSPSPLPDLPIQYADFAEWQRAWFQNQVLEKQLTYWKQQLAEFPPLLELPTDQPR
nr:condensation domain-containing protein [Pseudomonadota bacterium]